MARPPVLGDDPSLDGLSVRSQVTGGGIPPEGQPCLKSQKSRPLLCRRRMMGCQPLAKVAARRRTICPSTHCAPVPQQTCLRTGSTTIGTTKNTVEQPLRMLSKSIALQHLRRRRLIPPISHPPKFLAENTASPLRQKASPSPTSTAPALMLRTSSFWSFASLSLSRSATPDGMLL